MTGLAGRALRLRLLLVTLLVAFTGSAALAATATPAQASQARGSHHGHQHHMPPVVDGGHTAPAAGAKRDLAVAANQPAPVATTLPALDTNTDSGSHEAAAGVGRACATRAPPTPSVQRSLT